MIGLQKLQWVPHTSPVLVCCIHILRRNCFCIYHLPTCLVWEGVPLLIICLEEHFEHDSKVTMCKLWVCMALLQPLDHYQICQWWLHYVCYNYTFTVNVKKIIRGPELLKGKRNYYPSYTQGFTRWGISFTISCSLPPADILSQELSGSGVEVEWKWSGSGQMHWAGMMANHWKCLSPQYHCHYTRPYACSLCVYYPSSCTITTPLNISCNLSAFNLQKNLWL